MLTERNPQERNATERQRQELATYDLLATLIEQRGLTQVQDLLIYLVVASEDEKAMAYGNGHYHKPF